MSDRRPGNVCPKCRAWIPGGVRGEPRAECGVCHPVPTPATEPPQEVRERLVRARASLDDTYWRLPPSSQRARIASVLDDLDRALSAIVEHERGR